MNEVAKAVPTPLVSREKGAELGVYGGLFCWTIARQAS